MYFHHSPLFQKLLFNKFIWKKEVDKKKIYLTFDDGPTPEVTEFILKILDDYKAKATFFLVGRNILHQPALTHQIIANNHGLGNHTFAHSNGWKLNSLDYERDISKCDKILRKMGVQTKLFRPPYGRINCESIKQISSEYEIIMWTFLSGDFDQKVNIKKSIKSMKKLNSGSILVFHDNLKAFKNLQKLLPEALSFFSSQGYSFDKL